MAEEIDTKVIATLAITGLAAAASIGAAGITGAVLGSCNLGKVSGVAKIFMPVGIAGLSAAGGYMAGDAMRRACGETLTAVEAMKVMMGQRASEEAKDPETES